jgi:hypothetical protein
LPLIHLVNMAELLLTMPFPQPPTLIDICVKYVYNNYRELKRSNAPFSVLNDDVKHHVFNYVLRRSLVQEEYLESFLSSSLKQLILSVRVNISYY